MDRLTNDRLQQLYRAAVASGQAAHGAHVAPEALQRLVAREGAESERLEALDHVMSCSTCREGYDLLRAVDASRPAEPRRRWMVGSIAAAALLIVGVSLVRPWSTAPDDVMRGSAAPVLVGPQGGVAAEAARVFAWRPVARAIRYDFELLEANGTLVHSAGVPDTSYTLPLSIALAPARDYQWLVTAELADGTMVPATASRFSVCEGECTR